MCHCILEEAVEKMGAYREVRATKVVQRKEKRNYTRLTLLGLILKLFTVFLLL
jgi:hypothetical protein